MRALLSGKKLSVKRLGSEMGFPSWLVYRWEKGLVREGSLGVGQRCIVEGFRSCCQMRDSWCRRR